jgi:hypothetical protein
VLVSAQRLFPLDRLVKHAVQFKLTANTSMNTFAAEGGIHAGKKLEE